MKAYILDKNVIQNLIFCVVFVLFIWLIYLAYLFLYSSYLHLLYHYNCSLLFAVFTCNSLVSFEL